MQVIVPPKPSQSIETASQPLAVSVREAAALLSVSERSVWNLAKRGEIQSRHIGSRVVFPIESIRSFLAGTAGELVQQ